MGWMEESAAVWEGRAPTIMKALKIFEADVVRSLNTLLFLKLFPPFACEIKMPLGKPNRRGRKPDPD